jgi:hypothetical protein
LSSMETCVTMWRAPGRSVLNGTHHPTLSPSFYLQGSHSSLFTTCMFTELSLALCVCVCVCVCVCLCVCVSPTVLWAAEDRALS